MRKLATLTYIVTWMVLSAAPVFGQEIPSDVGKPPDWDAAVPAPPSERGMAIHTIQVPAEEDSTETPNARRRRLGLAPETSAPPPELGSAEETPNHQKQRVAQAPVTAAAR